MLKQKQRHVQFDDDDDDDDDNDDDDDYNDVGGVVIISLKSTHCCGITYTWQTPQKTRKEDIQTHTDKL